jgi:hypothetical protein
MRHRWVYDKNKKEMVPYDEYHAEPVSAYVRGDLQPYQSMKTGEMIEGRAAHREHLKRHSLVEIGDAWDKSPPKPKPIESPKGLRETLARVVYEKLQYK